MKKNIFFLYALVFFAHSVFAQDNNPPPENNTPPDEVETEKTSRRFGAQAILGFNASQLEGDGMDGYNHLGVNGGLRAFVRISPKVSVSMDILYTQLGAQSNKIYSSALRTINLDYIQVPLLVHYTDWRIQMGAGVSYSRLANYKVVDIYGLDLTDNAYKDVLRNYDIMAHIEATFLASKRWGVNLQYAQSLMNIDSRTRESADIRYDFPFLYGRFLSLRALYSF